MNVYDFVSTFQLLELFCNYSSLNKISLSFIRAADEEEKRAEAEAAALEAEKQNQNENDDSVISNFDLILPIVLELSDKVVELKSANIEPRPFTAARLAALMQKDCFLVFRSLCKLSMKPLPGKPSLI
jgi:hypothetical protein